MKKKYELDNMLKDLKILDLIVGIVLMSITYIVNKHYLWVCILGFMLGIISFCINSYVTKYVFENSENDNSGLILISYFLRIFIITIIGVVLFTYNKLNVIVYIIGYTCNFFSLIIYALFPEKKC